ncbi:TylF/MycF family methyltransferase [Rhabdobacter roseus]|uniref:Macrocin O-methyltransferase n=1 Tax=Rhabdobacter roseus TaxID=1655419 RepID=A0A840TNN8_9BACT|nr:TylF/MycF/NovP-related O-methyltransferase [Rhabdobacter roseus]MBB5284974.1 hypothetical protein [Rhabdobacter roseus]
MKKLTKKVLELINYPVEESKPIQEPVENETSDQEKDYWYWLYSDFTSFEKDIIQQALPYTMTSQERLVNLIRAIEYLVKQKIEGDFVECGVWKGGSSMVMALTLANLGEKTRNLHLYDTFDGMSTPSEKDESIDGQKAEIQLNASSKSISDSVWCYSALEEVQQNLLSTEYPKENIHFIEGKVEDTIPHHLPDKIALLRLDTDWYESTKHELNHLFPRLVPGGILIIDDYGHWKGCRQAVDEYFQENNIPIFLMRIDYTGRMAIKI